MKETAVEAQIPVFQPERIKDGTFYPVLQELNPDVIIVVAFVPDITQRNIRTAKIRMHERACVFVAKASWCSTDPVVCY